MRRAYGKGLSDVFGLPPAPSLVARKLAHSTAAVTEIRCNLERNGLTQPIARDEAFLLTLQLRDCPRHELWIDGRAMRTAHLAAGTVCLYDLRTDPRVYSISPFHNLHFYFTRAALIAAADGADLARLDSGAHNPGVGLVAPELYALGRSLLPALAAPNAAATPFVEHVTQAVAAFVAHRFGGAPSLGRPRAAR